MPLGADAHGAARFTGDGKIKTGHCYFQTRPLGVETGQYPSSSLEKIARPSLDAAARQGAQLINWASADERNKFVHSLTSLATPFEKKETSYIRLSTAGTQSSRLKAVDQDSETQGLVIGDRPPILSPGTYTAHDSENGADTSLTGRLPDTGQR